MRAQFRNVRYINFIHTTMTTCIQITLNNGHPSLVQFSLATIPNYRKSLISWLMHKLFNLQNFSLFKRILTLLKNCHSLEELSLSRRIFILQKNPHPSKESSLSRRIFTLKKFLLWFLAFHECNFSHGNYIPTFRRCNFSNNNKLPLSSIKRPQMATTKIHDASTNWEIWIGNNVNSSDNERKP